MASLLEVIITFVGAILVLALAAQSLQEVIKSSIAIKSGARLTAMKRLVTESATAAGLQPGDAEDIVKRLIARLGALGQPGLLKRNIRLDVVDKEKLRDLIIDLQPSWVRGLEGVAEPEGKAKLVKVADHAHKWFDLSVDPVDDRHERRMKIGAVIAGAAVVLAVNADAFWIMDHARNDPAFRSAVATQADSMSADARLVQAINDTLNRDTTASDSLFEGLTARLDSATARRNSRALAALSGGAGLFPGYDGWKFSGKWLLGILISALLVGLGAPFWHDLLSSLMGVKERVQAQAQGAKKDAEKPN
jgi:hypothetical protein